MNVCVAYRLLWYMDLIFWLWQAMAQFLLEVSLAYDSSGVLASLISIKFQNWAD